MYYVFIYTYICITHVYIYIHIHTHTPTFVYTSPLILISFWVIESFFCEPHQLTSWYTGDAFLTSKEVDYGAVVWKCRVQTSILKSWVDHHQAAKQQHMYIYIYIGFGQSCFLLQSGHFFVSPKKNVNGITGWMMIFLLWPVSTNLSATPNSAGQRFWSRRKPRRCGHF